MNQRSEIDWDDWTQRLIEVTNSMSTTMARMAQAMQDMADALNSIATKLDRGPSAIAGVCAVKDFE